MLRKPSEVMIGDRTLENVLNDEYTRPDLSHTDLSHIDFSDTNLAHANLSWSNFSDSVFENTDLCNADLSNAILRGAKFINAQCKSLRCEWSDLSFASINHSDFACSTLAFANFSDSKINDANFQHANLRHANFDYVTFFNNIDITGAKLEYANFTCCDLSSAGLIGDLIEYRKGKVLTEPIIGYKKCLTDDKLYTIVTLEIPRGAIVFSINGNSCRTNKVKVIDIADGYKRAYSEHAEHFSYYIGDEINIYDFDLQYNNECSSGIHFFMTREEAEHY